MAIYENLDLTLSLFIDKLRQAGFEQAPEVVDGAIRAIYWDGVMQVSAFVVLVLLTLVCVILVLTGLFSIRLKNNGQNDPAVGIGAIGCTVCGFAAVLAGTGANPWLKVFDPQAAFYQQIMEAVF